MWLLARIKDFLSIEHRVQFYKTYIQPHIDYCNIIWGNAKQTNLNRLFRLQKRACKIILDYNVDDINQCFKQLKIMTVYERVYFRKSKFMFKVANSLTPSYISELFTIRQADDTMPLLRSHTKCSKQFYNSSAL